MEFNKLIERRKSIREFNDKELARETIYNLQEFYHGVKALVQNIRTNFHFIEKGHELHDKLLGKVGYNGMAVDAPYYLILTSEVKENYRKNASYVMEQVLLKAYDMEIGSCWLDIVDDGYQDELRSILGIDKQDEVVAMAALGYPKTNAFGIETTVSDRESVENLVYNKVWGNPMRLEDLQKHGLDAVFYYVRNAPSWGNRQLWRFIIDDDKLLLNIMQEDSYIVDSSKNYNHELDCGIMMFYIEKMMHEEGIKGEWNLDIHQFNEEEYQIPENYKIMGCFPI